MADESEKKGGNSIVRAVLTAVIIALLVGGSAPWWWSKLFPPEPKTPGALPRVVLHLAKGDPRNLADQVRTHLLREGYNVPAIVSVKPSTTPVNTEVRYFRDAERSKGDAVLNEFKTIGIPAVLSYRPEFGSIAPLNQIEVWFSRRPTS